MDMVLADPGLIELLERSAVAIHPLVIGEIACGNLRDRDAILELLQDLPAVVVASDAEVLHCIERHALYGKGIGYVDVHLLASSLLTDGSTLWTRDVKLLRVAVSIGCAH